MSTITSAPNVTHIYKDFTYKLLGDGRWEVIHTSKWQKIGKVFEKSASWHAETPNGIVFDNGRDTRKQAAELLLQYSQKPKNRKVAP